MHCGWAIQGGRCYIVAHLAERAPGQMLSDVIRYKKFELGTSRFNDLVNGLGCFLKDATPKNYVMGDIKPDNIIFQDHEDIESEQPREVKVIDTGGARRGKALYTRAENNEKRTREIKIKTKKGDDLRMDDRFLHLRMYTSSYASPLVLTHSYYQSTIDAHSIAMTWLKALSPSDFIIVQRTWLKQKLHLEDASIYLEKYLTLAGLNSTISKILNANSEDALEMKKFLKLTFELQGKYYDSAVPHRKEIVEKSTREIDQAFRVWEEAFHKFQLRHGYLDDEGKGTWVTRDSV